MPTTGTCHQSVARRASRPVDSALSFCAARLPGGESAYFCATNRNKRSLSLNIRSAAGQRVMRQLLATADIFMCNIPRDDSLRRAELDAPTLRAAFPRLIYASITGYGR